MRKSRRWKIRKQTAMMKVKSFLLSCFSRKVGTGIISLFCFFSFFPQKKDACVVTLCVRPSVCLCINFLAYPETHRTKIFSLALSILMLETIQIWLVSINALGIILVGWCEEKHPTAKNSLQHSHGWAAAFNIVTKWDFLEMKASLWLNGRSQNVAKGWLST